MVDTCVHNMAPNKYVATMAAADDDSGCGRSRDAQFHDQQDCGIENESDHDGDDEGDEEIAPKIEQGHQRCYRN